MVGMNLKNIIKNHSSAVKQIIKRITNEENEELEQEIYLKVWKNSTYQEKGLAGAWIKKISANTSKDYLKSASKKQSDLKHHDENLISLREAKTLSPEQHLSSKETQNDIVKAINKLKPNFKEVIILHHFQDYSYEEIAQKIKCPLGTVKSRIYNAKKQLATELQQYL